MKKEIDFYYEFSSPYGYLAAMKIGQLAEKHHARVNWKPFLLGAIFKHVGTKPLLDYPFKGEYSAHDMERTARLNDLPFTLPEKFPIMAVNACRLIIWAAGNDMDKRGQISRAIYHAAYAEGKDISDAEVLMNIIEEHGYDRNEALVGIKSDSIKEALKLEVDKGIERKVFGSPFFVVEGEAFWGFDRMDQLDKWLETGGW